MGDPGKPQNPELYDANAMVPAMEEVNFKSNNPIRPEKDRPGLKSRNRARPSPGLQARTGFLARAAQIQLLLPQLESNNIQDTIGEHFTNT